MIIGTGLLGKAFSKNFDPHDIIIFASGVSNSKDNNQSEFEREKKLLLNSIRNNIDKQLFYFSSCSIEEIETPYTRHKKNMENLIKRECHEYTIFRLSQVAGGNTKNKGFLLNYLYEQINNEKSFEIWNNVRRNIIDVDDVVNIVKYYFNNIKSKNSVINIASPYNMPVVLLVEYIEKFLNKKAKYELTQKGKEFKIDIDDIIQYKDIENLFSKNSEEYIKKILNKHY